MISKFTQSKYFWHLIWLVSFLFNGNILVIILNITDDAMLSSYLPRTLGKTCGLVFLPFLLTFFFNWISSSKNENESKEAKFRRIFFYTWIIFIILTLFGRFA